MQIYFVRHGRTQFNLEHRFQGGRSDSPLLPDGIAGAQAAGRYLAATQFARVYSSPQQRALDTAKYVVAENQWQPTVTVEPGFQEFDFGSWDGQKEAEVRPRAYAQVLLNQPGDYDPKRAGGGESYATFVARTTAAVRKVVAAAGVANPLPVLVVAHGLVTTMTVKTLLGVPVAKLRAPMVVNGRTLKTVGNGIVDNDSLTVIETDDNQNFTLKKWNDTHFLGD
ncbi:histidine phosphatase family protein [Lactiplantibacillus garii]|uniref:Histidine phosphatase family protein n=1 Tax=Lactiplantibacillus garii TaxID=2306423 RepID=A0A426DAN3_9LACO|nr:histidine phosphatase family protein [Lactiplantibacillus garii]RRK11657.1 histidine phosphatase family protein [Lactiplantibacillus garii]